MSEFDISATIVLVLAATAVLVYALALQAETRNPPIGKWVDVEGVRLHYLEKGFGEPLVLLHGNGTMIADWVLSGLAPVLAQRFRVIAIDRPGFGYTSRPRGRLWTPSAQADLVRKILGRLGVERPIVIGHSWGTMVSLALALDHPHDVRGLVLLSGYYFPTGRADASRA